MPRPSSMHYADPFRRSGRNYNRDFEEENYRRPMRRNFEGRFSSEDEADFYPRRRSARWSEDEDYRYARFGGRDMRDYGRDYGRSEEEDRYSAPRRFRSQFRSRDDESRSSGSSRAGRSSSGSRTSKGPGRGWHGDPEGHARAGSHSHDNTRARRKSASKSSRAASSRASKSSSRSSKSRSGSSTRKSAAKRSAKSEM